MCVCAGQSRLWELWNLCSHYNARLGLSLRHGAAGSVIWRICCSLFLPDVAGGYDVQSKLVGRGCNVAVLKRQGIRLRLDVRQRLASNSFNLPLPRMIYDSAIEFMEPTSIKVEMSDFCVVPMLTAMLMIPKTGAVHQ